MRVPNSLASFGGTLALGLASIGVFVTAPDGSAWQVGAWFVPQVLATALLAARWATVRITAFGPLGLLVAGQLTYLVASIYWYPVPIVSGEPLRFPSPVDAAFFAAYGCYAASLLGLLRRYGRDRSAQRITLVDSLILTTPASAVLWVELISPQLGTESFLTTVVVVLYASFTLLLFALAARMAISLRLTRSAPALLMLVWIGSEVAGDLFYGFQGANGTFSYAGSLMPVWMVSYTALACLAAHPGVVPFLKGELGAGREPQELPRSDSAWVRNLRLAVLLLAALIPLPLHEVYHDNSPSLLVASAVTFVLVTYRISLVSGDLHEQKRMAGALEEAVGLLQRQRDELARYATIVESTDDAVITVALDGRITDWNAGAERLYGYTREEALEEHIALVTASTDADLVASVAGEVMAEGHLGFETVNVHKDGSSLDVSLTLSVICGERGEATGIVGIARDITGRKALDAQLHQDSKLESLGRLSAGLAHEINSPIQFVGDNARFLEEAYQELISVVGFYRGLLDSDNPIGWAERQDQVRKAEAGIDFEYLQKEIPSAVEQTLEGIERVSTIVRAMKTFSHPGHSEQSYADLNEALQATVTVTRHQVKEVAELQLDLGDLPPVRCDIAELNQVFLNLIVNAADAVEGTGRRGTIGITTAVDGDDVVISIADTGTGIPDDIRAKIFDPFFTTKEVGRGTGQGLPLVRAVVQEGHGGALGVQSSVDGGSTFTIRLPVEGLVAS